MSRGKARPLVPKLMRKTVFNMFHMLNHSGTRPTITKVEDRYYWPTLWQDVSKWIGECVICLQIKHKKTTKPPPAARTILPPSALLECDKWKCQKVRGTHLSKCGLALFSARRAAKRRSDNQHRQTVSRSAELVLRGSGGGCQDSTRLHTYLRHRTLILNH